LEGGDRHRHSDLSGEIFFRAAPIFSSDICRTDAETVAADRTIGRKRQAAVKPRPFDLTVSGPPMGLTVSLIIGHVSCRPRVNQRADVR